jgi:hypothetical protein
MTNDFGERLSSHLSDTCFIADQIRSLLPLSSDTELSFVDKKTNNLAIFCHELLRNFYVLMTSFLFLLVIIYPPFCYDLQMPWKEIHTLLRAQRSGIPETLTCLARIKSRCKGTIWFHKGQLSID